VIGDNGGGGLFWVQLFAFVHIHPNAIRILTDSVACIDPEYWDKRDSRNYSENPGNAVAVYRGYYRDRTSAKPNSRRMRVCGHDRHGFGGLHSHAVIIEVFGVFVGMKRDLAYSVAISPLSPLASGKRR
jgi:hypothetical protein